MVTRIVSPNSRAQVYADIRRELAAGRQLFVVCPLISDTKNAGAVSVSAERTFEQLKRQDFAEFRIGLLHGKLKADQKNNIMQQFVDRQLDILISTTVIEVRVDVPMTTVMLLESADRFGLAQIHQLRGRVGRGKHQGYCFLMMSDSSAPSQRLRAIEQSTMDSGWRNLIWNCAVRGLFMVKPSTAPLIWIAQLTDTKLLAAARQAANTFIAHMDTGENLIQYPQLSRRVMLLRAVTNLN